MNESSISVCIVQEDPAQCIKIKECTLNEMNCARWRQNIPRKYYGKIFLEVLSLTAPKLFYT